jgi:sirohydrochlorin ferrochelatase
VTPLLLVAHGSRDPRAAASTEALVRRVAAARPDLPVAAGYLEHRGPRPADAASRWPAATSVAVLPLLLTAAYHASVDLPAVAARLPVPARLGRVLGGDDGVLEALDATADLSDVDGLVLAAAGTRDAVARGAVERAAARYGQRHGAPCLAAYAAGGGRDVPAAVAVLRSAGARRIGVLSYFLAPGVLHDRIVAAAAEAAVPLLGQPFGATAPLAELVLRRYDEICPPWWTVRDGWDVDAITSNEVPTPA